jgi:hypothetical protein
MNIEMNVPKVCSKILDVFTKPSGRLPNREVYE